MLHAHPSAEVDLTIRRAEPRHAAVLAQLGRETFHETFVEGFAIPYPTSDLTAYNAQVYSPEAYAARLSDPAYALWLAGPDQRPLAYAVAGPAQIPHPDATSADGELKLLYVRQEAQGHGLGPALLNTALAWLERDGRRNLWISVWSGNDRAQQLYARYGFRKAGEYQFPVGEWRDEEWILARSASTDQGRQRPA